MNSSYDYSFCQKIHFLYITSYAQSKFKPTFILNQYNLIFYNYFSDKNLPSGFPRIKQNPKMKVVEKGRNAILVCEAEGDPPVNIYWVKDSIRLRRDPRFTVMQQGKLRGEREQFFV